jgi:chemotaxis protein CheX
MEDTKNVNRFLGFSRPFIIGAKSVFETMIFTEISPQKPFIKKEEISKGDVSSIMGLSGSFEVEGENKSFKGMMVLSFPTETYVKVANAMLMEEFEDYCDEIADVGAEITNIITGNAKRSLKEIGYSIEMSIPSVVHGKGHKIKYPPKTNIIVIPISSVHGEFFLELCYQDFA